MLFKKTLQIIYILKKKKKKKQDGNKNKTERLPTALRLRISSSRQ